MDEGRTEPDASFDDVRRAIEFQTLRLQLSAVAGSGAALYEARARRMAERTGDLDGAMERVIEEAVLGAAPVEPE